MTFWPVPRTSRDELRYTLRDSGASVAFVSAPFAELVDGLRSQLPALTHVVLVGVGTARRTSPTPSWPTARASDCCRCRIENDEIGAVSVVPPWPCSCSNTPTAGPSGCARCATSATAPP